MKKFIQNKLKNEKGMTLIELLAVIVIIAIIAAIAIPAISNIIENSRVGAAKSDALNAFAAADLYKVDNAGANAISQVQLTEGGFLDDVGGFGDTISFETATTSVSEVVEVIDADGIVTTPGVAAVEPGDLLLTGTATVGGVVVKFAKTPRDVVQALSNSAETGGDVAPPSSITVTR